MELISNKFDSYQITKYYKDQIPDHILKNEKLEEKFLDHFFPPDRNSLLALDKEGKFIDPEEGPLNAGDINEKELEWKRASDILNEPQIFQDLIEFNDVNQGIIGNCYFLSSISAITEFPYIIYEKFRIKNCSEKGYYELVLFIDGEWQVVFVDDYFPVYKGTKQFAFSKPNGNELWVILLEKAWSKVNGGYINTIAGIVSESLYALTGFSTEYVLHKEYKLNDLYRKVEKADNEDLIMCCATKCDDSITKVGLVEGHAYTLIAADKYLYPDRNNEELQLLKLRNPWGYKEWTGDWSDKSKKWTEELKKHFGHEDKNDGTFFISLEDYVQYFNSTYICHIMYGAYVKSYTIKYEKYLSNPIVFNFELLEDAKVSLSVIFKNWRFNRHLKHPRRPFNLVLAQYNEEKEIIFMNGEYTARDNIEHVNDLKKGYYVVWLYCPYELYVDDKPLKYVFKIASMKKFKSKFMGIDGKHLLIEKLIVDNSKLINSKAISSCKDFYIGTERTLSKAGLSCITILNKNKNWLKIQLTPKTLYNVKLLSQFDKNQSIEILVPPYQGTVVIATRMSYDSCDYDFSVKAQKMQDSFDKKYSPPDLDNFLSLRYEEFDESNLSMPCFQYHIISNEQVKIVPKFDTKSIKTIKFESKNSSEIKRLSIEDLMKENKNLTEMILDLEETVNERELYWTIKSNYEGTYIGQINFNYDLSGRGAFIHSTGETYVGYWTEGKIDKTAKVYDVLKNIIYEGEYKLGVREGVGRFTYPNGDIYEGEFIDNMIHGAGIFKWNNGNRWEGKFCKNMKHGLGIMFFPNMMMEIIEYENDNIIKRNKIKKSTTIQLEEIHIQTEIRNNSESHAHKSKLEDCLKSINAKLNFVTKMTELFVGDSSLDASHLQIPMKAIDDLEIEDAHQMLKRKGTRLKELSLIDPFMFDMLMDIPCKDSLINEELSYIPYENGFYIGAVSNKERHGRGSYYWKNTEVAFHIGYFEYERIKGFGRRFDKEKGLVYEGEFFDGLYNGHGKLYLSNGNVYEGHFKNNKKHGKGTYYWPGVGRWEGQFHENKFHGEGKYYYENSVMSEVLIYDFDTIVKRSNLINEDELLVGQRIQIDELKKQQPELMNKILRFSPHKNNHDLKWDLIKISDDDFYLGQISKEGKEHGRGARKFSFTINNREVIYYIGYFDNGIFNNRGCFYDKAFNLVYEGHFLNGLMNGKGRFYYLDNDEYDGNWKNNKQDGVGVFKWSNGFRWEGTFESDVFHGAGTYVYYDQVTTESIEYRDSNIVARYNLVNHSDKEIIREKSAKIKKLENYKFLLNKIFNLKKTNDDTILDWVKKDCKDGYYVGQVNHNGQFHGRGAFLYHFNKQFYVGYWINGYKEKYGELYFNDNQLFYKGEYQFNIRRGKGTYYYLNKKDYFTGEFNELGNGNGTYYWENGNYFIGSIFNFMLHGKGKYYSKAQLVGDFEYKYHKLLK